MGSGAGDDELLNSADSPWRSLVRRIGACAVVSPTVRRMHGRPDRVATRCYPRGHAVEPDGGVGRISGTHQRATLLHRGPVSGVQENRIG
jgi:hypothetical protein